jgi:hypothetical protein
MRRQFGSRVTESASRQGGAKTFEGRRAANLTAMLGGCYALGRRILSKTTAVPQGGLQQA